MISDSKGSALARTAACGTPAKFRTALNTTCDGKAEPLLSALSTFHSKSIAASRAGDSALLTSSEDFFIFFLFPFKKGW